MQPAQVPKTGFVRTKMSERIVEAGALEVLEEGGGLAAGEDEGVEKGEFVGLTDEMRGGAKFSEALCVDVEGALEGEDADVRGVFAHP